METFLGLVALCGQWRGVLMFSLIYAWINGWANNREAGDLRRHRAHLDVTVMGGTFSYMVNNMVADVLATQSAMASAAMLLAYFLWYIQVSPPERLTLIYCFALCTNVRLLVLLAMPPTAIQLLRNSHIENTKSMKTQPANVVGWWAV